MTRIQVTIISESKTTGKPDMQVVETDTLLSAVRIMHTAKPKRGYKIKKMIMEEVEVLV